MLYSKKSVKSEGYRFEDIWINPDCSGHLPTDGQILKQFDVICLLDFNYKDSSWFWNSEKLEEENNRAFIENHLNHAHIRGEFVYKLLYFHIR